MTPSNDLKELERVMREKFGKFDDERTKLAIEAAWITACKYKENEAKEILKILLEVNYGK